MGRINSGKGVEVSGSVELMPRALRHRVPRSATEYAGTDVTPGWFLNTDEVDAVQRVVLQARRGNNGDDASPALLLWLAPPKNKVKLSERCFVFPTFLNRPII
jgi:hypothetical protein